ncbi:MAG: chromate transporter [Clostridia bacterium]
MKEKIKLAFKLFLIYFKIGLFTFGGGYAMISLIQKEFAEKRKMITEDELLEIIAIAESTPGPIAINSATFIGFKACGVLGALFATIGVVLPSFVIIMLISLVFDQFMQFVVVQNAFKGIQVAVGILIVSAGIKMFKKVKKTPFTMIVFFSTVVVMSLIDIFVWSFSSIYLIIIGGVSGMLFYAIGDAITTAKTKKKRDNSIPVDQNQQTEEKSTDNCVAKDEPQNVEILTDKVDKGQQFEKMSTEKAVANDEPQSIESTDEKAQSPLAKSANNCDNCAQTKCDELKVDELLAVKDKSSAKEKKL